MKIIIGNIFNSKLETLVNTINCVGVMGKGIALEFKNRFPEMYLEYLQKCNSFSVKPGVPYIYRDLSGKTILNFPTKDDWRSPSNIEYIKSGLRWFSKNYKSLNINSIAFPPLGCGNGGLLWEDVGPIMYKELSKLPIDIEIYAPYGTKKEYLTIEYLSDIKNISRKIGVVPEKFNDNWFCILEILYELNTNEYSNYVGRTMFQKICYLSTLEGLKTGFCFDEGSYGPFSFQVKEAYKNMANSLYIYEERKGRMDAIFTTKNFEIMRKQKINIINKNRRIINKMIDIFTRIKNTEQAELYSTIIFSYYELKRNSTDIDCKSLINYIIKWKPHWNKFNKIEDIKKAIKGLVVLKYINVNVNVPYCFNENKLIEFNF